MWALMPKAAMGKAAIIPILPAWLSSGARGPSLARFRKDEQAGNHAEPVRLDDKSDVTALSAFRVRESAKPELAPASRASAPRTILMAAGSVAPLIHVGCVRAGLRQRCGAS